MRRVTDSALVSAAVLVEACGTVWLLSLSNSRPGDVVAGSQCCSPWAMPMGRISTGPRLWSAPKTSALVASKGSLRRLLEAEGDFGGWSVARTIRSEVFTFTVAPAATPNASCEFQFMCV